MANANELQLAYILEDYDRLVKQVEAMERRMAETAEIEARRSSIEVGTGAKGGAVKIYLDPFGDAKKNDEAVAEMVRLLRAAGGTPTAPAP
jgi:hypothetical protein